MTRVQIPAYTDRWMMGDRYGEVVKVTRRARRAPQSDVRTITDRPTAHGAISIAHVKLDKSGKTVRVILDDCTVVS